MMRRAPVLWLTCLLAGKLLAGCAAPGGMVTVERVTQVPVDRQIIVAVHNEPARVQRRAGSNSRPYGIAGGYSSALHAQQRVADLARRYELQAVAHWPITLLDLYCVVFELPQGRPRDTLLAEVAQESGVVIAQPMQQFNVLEGPRDTAVAGMPASVASMGITAAHEWATGRGVKVALIDTGVDRSHPDLAGRVIGEADFVGRREFPPAEEAHGLAVAGVIAARANPSLGTVGVAPQAQLLALRACWHTDPFHAVCNSLTLARAIAAAVGQAADVINLSLTGPSDPLLERLLARAMDRGVIVVGAVPEIEPRSGGTREMTGFPTGVPGVIPVRSAELAGASQPGYLRAPGRDIVTLRPGGGHAVSSGSSLAAAHVSGVVALLLERKPHLVAAEARALLGAHTRSVTEDGREYFEVVNACLALAAIVEGRCSDLVEQAAGRRSRVAAPQRGAMMPHE